MIKKLPILALISLLTISCGFARDRYSPTAMKESFTHKDPNFTYREGVFALDASRSKVIQAFGQPNGSDQKNGLIQDVYIFFPDGTKYVNPSPRPRNYALAVVTMGTSVAVRQARLAYQRTKLRIFHVYYDSDQTILRVTEESGKAYNPLPEKTH